MAMTRELEPSTIERSVGVQSLIEQLQQRFRDVQPDVLARIVDDEYRRLAAGATVVTYLPVLTLRAAVRCLSSLGAA